jgi:hypothetical protein
MPFWWRNGSTAARPFSTSTYCCCGQITLVVGPGPPPPQVMIVGGHVPLSVEMQTNDVTGAMSVFARGCATIPPDRQQSWPALQQFVPQHVSVAWHAEADARRHTFLPPSSPPESAAPPLPSESTPLSGVPPELELDVASGPPPPVPVSPATVLSLPPPPAASLGAPPDPPPDPPLLLLVLVPSSPVPPLPLLPVPLLPPLMMLGGPLPSLDSPSVDAVPLQSAVATTASPRRLI